MNGEETNRERGQDAGDRASQQILTAVSAGQNAHRLEEFRDNCEDARADDRYGRRPLLVPP